MPWPTDPNYTALAKTHLDAPGDSPSSARAQIEAMLDRLGSVQALLEQIVQYGAPVLPAEFAAAAVRRPIIINSSCLVNQYGGPRDYSYSGSGPIDAGVGGLDRYYARCGCAGAVLRQERSNMVIGGRHRHCVKQTMTTATPSAWPDGLSGVLGICQVIEWRNMAALQQDAPCTLSFWFQASAPGLYAATLFPHTALSRVTQVFEVLQANTPQRVVVQYPIAPDVLNFAFYTETAVSAPGWSVIIGAVGAPAGFHSPVLGQRNTDAAKANAVSHASVVDWTKTAGNYIALTGLQLDEGLVDAPIYREPSYEEELMRCQRYYYKTTHRVLGSDVGAGQDSRAHVAFPVTMRVTPSVTLAAGSQATAEGDIGPTGVGFWRSSGYVNVAPGTVFDAELSL